MSFFSSDYSSFLENKIVGRYISYNDIDALINRLKGIFEVDEIGMSVKHSPIKSVTFGNGSRKIFMWSQMHGNESTTTKAIFDLFNFILSGDSLARKILRECHIKIIPMLNPDGAMAYTRANANGIDLNRDAQNLSQPESSVLRNTYGKFRPDFCFNLHDQRTMYSVADRPATVSFLAPSMNEERDISASRGKSMQLIAAMHRHLQEFIPGQIGRYDDAFNKNCVGDSFQMMGTPTVLFEAGHYKEDYERERTRECIFMALKSGLETIACKRIASFPQQDYFIIPENGKRFFDILIKNVHFLDTDYDKGVHMGIRFEEHLRDSTIQFKPVVESVFGDGDFLGHQLFDCAQPEEVNELKRQVYFNTIFG